MILGKIAKPRTPVVEAGSYLAVCIGTLFIGEQYLPPFKEGKQKTGKFEHQLTLVWELPSELDEAGVPKQLSKDINIVFGDNSNLAQIMKSWNSREYTQAELKELDTDALLGKPCQLTVSVNDSGYAKVSAVAALPKGVPAPVSGTPYIKFDIEEWDDDAFHALPEWAQAKIEKSTQFQKLHAPEDVVDFEDGAEAGGKECPI